MPAASIVTICSFSPCLSVTLLLSARSSNALRSGAIDGVFRLAPFGLPLWPGLNRVSLGGQPGPTLYTSPDVDVGLEVMMKSFCKLMSVSPRGNDSGCAARSRRHPLDCQAAKFGGPRD